MQCPICTTEISEGVNVCPTCGYQVKSQSAQQNVYVQQPSGNQPLQQNMYERQPSGNQPMQQNMYERQPSGNQPLQQNMYERQPSGNQPLQKKKSKLPIIIACIAAVVVCGLGVGAYFLFFAEDKKPTLEEELSRAIDILLDENDIEEVTEEPEIEDIDEDDNPPRVTTYKEGGKVEINGVKYLEIPINEDADRLGYVIDGYGGVTLYSQVLETTDELELSHGGKTANFVAVVSHDGVIQGKLISVDLSGELYQLGNSDLLAGDFSEHYKQTADGDDPMTIKFGKAYYDYKKTLYVDILVITDEEMYTHTAEIDLTIE
ncbi:MAG: hypothetical protein MJ133_00020 [Lachnospiraceae bacterium]|nr:hypothetical protein [Lachnospiraceae bacterium]